MAVYDVMNLGAGAGVRLLRWCVIGGGVGLGKKHGVQGEFGGWLGLLGC